MLSYYVTLRSESRDFRIKTIFGSSLPPVVCWRAQILYLLYLCLFVYSGVQQYCVIFLHLVPYVASFPGLSVFDLPLRYTLMFILMQRVFSLANEGCQICSWHAWRNAIFLHRMHLFVNNMADPDISDYEFDADSLFRR